MALDSLWQAMTTKAHTSSRPAPALTTMVSIRIVVLVNNSKHQKMPVSTDCRAMAIGARSQAARTYLEKFLNDLRVPSKLFLSWPSGFLYCSLFSSLFTCAILFSPLQECELEELVKHLWLGF